MADGTLYLVQRNDLETAEIAAFLVRNKKRAERVCIVDRSWGDTIHYSDIARYLKDFDRVSMVEINNPDIERRLVEAGKTVTLIDHKDYASPMGGHVSRGHGLSAFQQVYRHFCPAAGPQDQLDEDWLWAERVSAREMGGMPALARCCFEHQWKRRGRAPLKFKDSAASNGRCGWPDDPGQWPQFEKTLAEIRHIRAADLVIAEEGYAALHGDAFAAGSQTVSDAKLQAMQSRLEQLAQEVGQAIENAGSPDAAYTDPSTTRIVGRYLRSGPLPNKAEDLLLLVAPLRERRLLVDAVYEYYFSQGEAYLQDHRILALYYPETAGADVSPSLETMLASICRLEFCGPAADRPVLEQVLEPDVRAEHGLDQLQAYLVGETGFYFGLEDVHGISNAPAAILNFCDFLLNNFLLGARPVVAWRTHFMQPLWLVPDADFSLDRLRKAAHAAITENTQGVKVQDIGDASYFMRHLRQQLGASWREGGSDPQSPSLVSLEITLSGNLADLAYVLDWPKGHVRQVQKVEHVRLHLFYNDTICLEWGVGYKAPEVSAGAGSLCMCLLSGGASQSLASMIDYNAKARYLYSEFEYSEDEVQDKGHYRLELHQGDKELAGFLFGCESATSDERPRHVLRKLVELALGSIVGEAEAGGYANRVQYLGDARARVATSVVLEGERPTLPGATARLDAVLDRLREVDGFGGGFNYDEDFARALLEQNRYRRHEQFGSYFVASDHAFAYLGFAGGRRTKSYAYDVIHLRQMNGVYLRMALLAQLYTAVLQVYSCKISDILKPWQPDKGEPLPQRYHALLPELLKFVNMLWFNQVSSQVQGIELFDLIRKPTQARNEYEMIRDEIERTQEYWDRESERRAENRIRALAFVGIPLTLFGGALGLYGKGGALGYHLAELGLDNGIRFTAFATVLTVFLTGLLWLVLLPHRRPGTLSGMVARMARNRSWLRRLAAFAAPRPGRIQAFSWASMLVLVLVAVTLVSGLLWPFLFP
ncbi:MAG: hypothetical protein EP335_05795 [Alphaproteobacteria bacterium]|nr:MAG: hypothetical protein EP335_05795 [Alphaproteobacteria bacterium]